MDCWAPPPLPPLLKEEGGVVPTVGRMPVTLPTVLPKIALGPLASKLKPKLRASVRFTSATTTSSWTCITPPTRIMLMTRSEPPTTA